MEFHLTRRLDQETERAWDDFVNTCAATHYAQTLGWAKLLAKRHTLYYFWGAEHKKFCISGLVVATQTGLPGKRILTMPHGPVFADVNVLEQALPTLERLCQTIGGLRLQMSPEWSGPRVAAVENVLAAHGFRSDWANEYPLSLRVALDLPTAEILASFRQTTRHEIAKFYAKGGSILHATERAALNQFWNLFAKAEYHQLFDLHPENLDVTWQEWFADGTRGLLLLSHFEKQVRGGVFVLRVGPIAWYVWGASQKEGAKLPLTHALLWEAMQWAKAQGCAFFDLGGWRALPNPENPSAGVPLFKAGFSREVYRFVRPHRAILAPRTYTLWQNLSRLKAKLAASRAGRDS